MSTAPPPAATRYRTLDGLRGVAVMGILLMNVGDFALPQAAYLQPLLGGRTTGDIAVWAGGFVVADGKFRNLFSLLFGASMLLVADRAAAAGRSGSVVHLNRMAWLLMFGLAHLYLLWWGDILHHYAIVGTIAFALRRLPPHKLFAIGSVVLAFMFLRMGGVAGELWSLRAAAQAPHASPAVIAAWRSAAGSLHLADAAGLARELALHRGGYAGLLHDRLTTDAALPVTELLSSGPETFALMLFGMASLRSGFVTGGWSRAAYRRVALGCYAAGLPVMVALTSWAIASGFDPLVCFAVTLALSLPVRAAIMFGHAAFLIGWLAHADGALARRVAAAGRMAFTNYLATSLVMALLFDGYGAGLYRTLGRAALLAPVAAMWALMLLWSKPWLDRFAYGPLEWLWRSLARRAPQPMRRTVAKPIAMHSQ